MKRDRALATLLGILIATGLQGGAHAQDRERAQLLQMQQQLQRLQSDNAALQKEIAQLKAKAQEDADALKKASATSGKDLARARAEAAAGSRETAALRAEMDGLRAQTETQIGQWKKAIADREDALQAAALEKRRNEAALALLQARLKLQTSRSDVCETKHAQALEFSARLIDKYAEGRARLCDPFAALWKVHDGNEVQGLRDQLYDLRLDATAPPAAAEVQPASSGK